jgi:hypothetical protein
MPGWKKMFYFGYTKDIEIPKTLCYVVESPFSVGFSIYIYKWSYTKIASCNLPAKYTMILCSPFSVHN